jgi:D-tyrosyl-tRNA(Tyr) deacylase
MRAVIQRVSKASVSVEDKVLSEIDQGLVVLLAVGADDNQSDIDYIVDKTVNLRIFEQDGKFDLSVLDVSGEILLISQFTLYGDVRRGRRPGFTEACPPDIAREIYAAAAQKFKALVPTKEGEFQAHMNVSLNNDGPVTILLDSKKTF